MKPSLIFLLLFLPLTALLAGPPESNPSTGMIYCDEGKDSALAHYNRGQLSCFLPCLLKKGQFNYVVIDTQVYHKTTYPKNTPSAEFVDCYNSTMKRALDSAFELSFLDKHDSILMSYDKKGKGYRSAEYPGGPAALQKHLNKSVSFPKDITVQEGSPMIQVFYSFMIDEEGKLSDFTLIKSNCKACEAPLLKVIEALPPFLPALEAGKPKRIKYILPFLKKL